MMASSVIIVLALFIMIFLIIKKPTITIGKITINTFWISPLICSLVLLLIRDISINDILESFNDSSDMNVIKILILFFSLSFISIVLDELGFFNYIVYLFISKFKKNQYQLFFIIYITVAILTIFTSNDIVILTITPFIIYFCKKVKINPIPFLIMEFITANTYSMFLIIGNPTNIYIASFYNISFIEYLKHMFLPTLGSGLISIPLLIIIFRKDLSNKLSPSKIEKPILYNKSLTIISIIHLALTTFLLAISNYINIDMWLICLFFGISLFGFILMYSIINKSNGLLRKTILRLPYSLIPFIISMFIIVISLDNNNVLFKITRILDDTNSIICSLKYGLGSSISCNIINNIPMSIAYSNIIKCSLIEDKSIIIYSTIIGSNLGAFLTPIGALAGIMWLKILKKNDIKFSTFSFIKYGFLIGVPMLFTAILLLNIIP